MTQLSSKVAGALRSCGLLLAAWAWVWGGSAVGKDAVPPPPVAPLPEGNTGIASKYIGDAGIEKDPAVVLHDDFESGNLHKWDGYYQKVDTRFTEEPANVHSGKKAIEFTVPKQDAELSNGVEKRFKPGYDIMFVRYYSKFEKGFDQVGSSHNGAYISSQYKSNGQSTPGIRADGHNKFLVGMENFRFDPKMRSPGQLNFYVYQPEQRSNYGDHFFPSGRVMPPGKQGRDEFGPSFTKRPEFIPELDRWYCYEFMVKANTPGVRDGRVAAWIDGKLTADFPNLRLRDVDTLKIDECSLALHIKSNTLRANKKWYDDVVMATSYIGPMVTEKPVPPKPVAKETPQPQAPVVQKPPPPAIPATALAPWELKLKERVAQGVKDGQNPTVWLKLMSGREEAVKVVGANEKTLSVEQEGGNFPLPWSWVSADDRLNLARAFLKEDSFDDQMLAAVLALAVNRGDYAEERFAKAEVLDPQNGARGLRRSATRWV